MILIIASSTSNAQHYYSDNRQISIGVDSTKVLVKFTSLLEAHSEEWAGLIGRINQYEDDSHVINGFEAFSLATKYDYYSFLDSLDTLPNVELVEPYYTGFQDSDLLIGDEFVVAFYDDVSTSQIESLNGYYGVVLERPVAHMGHVFVLRNTKQSGMRTLDIANLYYELKETIFSHPVFNVKIVTTNYNLWDEYSEFQPHLKKVIGSFNDTTVWDFSNLEEPIIVAVIDHGFEPHEDLPAERILPGYDFANMDSDPSPGPYPYSGNGHGMAVAGIIGASHKTSLKDEPPVNESGIFSIAPNSMILPIRIFDDYAVFNSFIDIASAISYAWKSGADIINCSWVFWGLPDEDWDLVRFAIDSAYSCGRGIDTLCSGNPLGCPVIFSSGNDGYDWVRFPSNLPTTLSIGAIQLDDYRWNYSQYGTYLDLVAPSGAFYVSDGDVWSLDQMGEEGYNPHTVDFPGGLVEWDCGYSSNDENYHCKFGGTSAAAPVVSGIAALILSYDDTLGVDAVYDILRNSAENSLDWGTITPPDNEYGYGRVDTYRAILSIARGDMNNNGVKDLSDITKLVDYVYLEGAPAFPDERMGNCNCSPDGVIDLADIMKLVDHVYESKAPLLPCFVYEYPPEE